MIRLILILSLFCSTIFSQKVIIVDTNTGKEYEKEYPAIESRIPGLNAGINVYYVLQKDMPSYDYLTEKLEPVKRFTDSIGIGNNYPYVVKEWRKVRLSDAEIIQRKQLAVLDKETELQINSVSDSKFKIEMSIAIAAIALQLEGKTLTPKQLESLEIVKAFGIKAYQNKQIREKLLQDIQTDPTTDIKGDWVK